MHPFRMDMPCRQQKGEILTQMIVSESASEGFDIGFGVSGEGRGFLCRVIPWWFTITSNCGLMWYRLYVADQYIFDCVYMVYHGAKLAIDGQQLLQLLEGKMIDAVVSYMSLHEVGGSILLQLPVGTLYRSASCCAGFDFCPISPSRLRGCSSLPLSLIHHR